MRKSATELMFENGAGPVGPDEKMRRADVLPLPGEPDKYYFVEFLTDGLRMDWDIFCTEAAARRWAGAWMMESKLNTARLEARTGCYSPGVEMAL
jgi:hypothetical protein